MRPRSLLASTLHWRRQEYPTSEILRASGQDGHPGHPGTKRIWLNLIRLTGTLRSATQVDRYAAVSPFRSSGGRPRRLHAVHPIKDSFGTSALKPTGNIPPEFFEFN